MTTILSNTKTVIVTTHSEMGLDTLHYSWVNVKYKQEKLTLEEWREM